ncbi:MAG: hypothetical protein REI78_00985 [Pedobacter sp.]|nr:hypothetical protein [Pedobacter sp.]MDQ8051562.1 hypothetical protein [Pedobacter sp.]
MSARGKIVGRWGTKDGYAYLTKKILMGRAKRAGKIAAKDAMEVMGYVVTVKDGWVVREHHNGTIEKIEKLQTA